VVAYFHVSNTFRMFNVLITTQHLTCPRATGPKAWPEDLQNPQLILNYYGLTQNTQRIAKNKLPRRAQHSLISTKTTTRITYI